MFPYLNEPLATGCKRVANECVITVPWPRPELPPRRSLRLGDRIREGLIVEIRESIAKLQQDKGEK